MKIYPDLTIVLQFAFFIASYWVLTRLLFPPVLNVVLRRRKMIEHSLLELKRIEQEGEQMKADYEGKLRQARNESQDIRRKARDQAAQEERDVVEQARQNAAQTLQGKQQEVKEKYDTLRERFDQDVEQLTQAIVEKVLSKRS